ncbi:uncharacterized protein PSFLO_03396 [Pseudozyma flocculosa]|uniref:Secreted protein n=1 Tax=Pseudozyma flocculosa TaxID=84751 RepID=A0A5C3F382_9BASI|nr:uncharacterized protein PSFLO_03396 [Pseudozyma flocculosa]
MSAATCKAILVLVAALVVLRSKAACCEDGRQPTPSSGRTHAPTQLRYDDRATPFCQRPHLGVVALRPVVVCNAQPCVAAGRAGW